MLRYAIFALAVLSAPLAAREVAPVSRDIGCVAQVDLLNDYTPPELARIVRDCALNTRPEDSMQVYFAYSAYALFDQQRVKDDSAHIVLQELAAWMFGGLTREEINALKEVAERLRDGQSAFLIETCDQLRRLGPPKYRPSYMIVRGVIPRKHAEDWLTDGFNPSAAWERALSDVNNCPMGSP